MNKHSRIDRRRFLGVGASLLGGLSFRALRLAAAPNERNTPAMPKDSSLIAAVEKHTLFHGREQGPTWFHPRACMIPGGDPPTALMTLQEIGGSDYFGPVHFTLSHDLGASWSAPAPIPALGRKPAADGAEEGVCDVVPEYHPPTASVLALGHNVFYRGGRFFADQPPRHPVYAVRRTDGTWSQRRVLEWDDPRGSAIYTNNCGQRVTLPDGDILLALSFGAGNAPRSVATARCSFDGETLTIRELGEELRHPAGRGLLEPSLTCFAGRYYLTLRAEDQRGYVSVSDDGFSWAPKRPWRWDDGEPLTMSTTQQHWLTHCDGLFLVYTRKDARNVNVIRWRSPLWVARVDPERLCLLRTTERVALPLVGDGVHDPDGVALMGNFHVTNATQNESWITVGEWRPRRGCRGDVLLARIRWRLPNRLAPPVSPARP